MQADACACCEASPAAVAEPCSSTRSCVGCEAAPVLAPGACSEGQCKHVLGLPASVCEFAFSIVGAPTMGNKTRAEGAEVDGRRPLFGNRRDRAFRLAPPEFSRNLVKFTMLVLTVSPRDSCRSRARSRARHRCRKPSRQGESERSIPVPSEDL